MESEGDNCREGAEIQPFTTPAKSAKSEVSALLYQHFKFDAKSVLYARSDACCMQVSCMSDVCCMLVFHNSTCLALRLAGPLSRSVIQVGPLNCILSATASVMSEIKTTRKHSYIQQRTSGCVDLYISKFAVRQCHTSKACVSQDVSV